MNSIFCWMVLMAGFNADGSEDGSKQKLPPVIFVHPEPDQPMTNPRPEDTPEQAQALKKIVALKGSVMRKDDGPRVYQVNFNGASLTGSELQCLRAFPDLEILVLWECTLADDDLSAVKSLPNLQVLGLRSSIQIGDIALKHIERHSRIESVALSRTSITDAGMESLATLPNLTVLDLADTKITNSGLKPLLRLKKLDELSLIGTKVDDEGVRLLAENVPSLRVISLARTSITDAALDALVALPKLESVILYETRITDRGIQSLSHLKHLKRIYLRGTGITNAAVAHLAKLKKLRSIDLNNTAIDDGCLDDLQQLKKIGNHVTYHNTKISREGKQRLSAKYQAELDRRLKSAKPIFGDDED
jgi:hypothetical protein